MRIIDWSLVMVVSLVGVKDILEHSLMMTPPVGISPLVLQPRQLEDWTNFCLFFSLFVLLYMLVSNQIVKGVLVLVE